MVTASSTKLAIRVLLLGGSSEASALARFVATDPRFDTVMSLAGRTTTPLAQPVRIRSGGFGGVEGLVRYLQDERINVVVDATHPFASQMSRNAIEAAGRSSVPLLAIERPPWQKQPDDIWIEVAGIADAVKALGSEPCTVFCGIGSLALSDLRAAPQHRYVIRLIDKPAQPLHLPNAIMIEARGPFCAEDDVGLFREHGIEAVLAKNSGADATVSKIEAARTLSLPVIMVSRPFIPVRTTVATADAALLWLDKFHGSSTLRGV
jgi:precorrin-6A/cobalt-precorrin-6A reductase